MNEGKPGALDGNSQGKTTELDEQELDLVARVVHDIKTPMNALTGLILIAGMHLHEPEMVADSLDKMSALSDYIIGQLNDVLDLSRMKSGQTVLEEKPFSLSDLLDNVFGMLHPDREAEKQTIHRAPPAVTHDTVVGDAKKLQQVLGNLLENSVKYTPEGGEVTLSLTEKDSRESTACYEFIIQDNGMGIEPEYLEHIFEPYTRSERAQAENIPGTGLGMAIAHTIIMMMDGTISVESEPDEGTTFTVTVELPFCAEEPDGYPI